MKCMNCGCELPEGSKFCFSCGAKQPEEIIPEEVIEEAAAEPEQVEAEETEPEQEEPEEKSEEALEAEEEQPAGEGKFCPYCGAKNDADAVFCCSCGQNMEAGEEAAVPAETEESSGIKKKFPVKLVVGAVAVIAVAGIAIKVAGGLFGGSNNNHFLAYLKDGRVNQVNLDRYKKEPVEYSGTYGFEGVEREERAKVVYSKDGKYIFYPTDYDYSSDGLEFRLNMQKVGKTEDPIKIDSSVSEYSVLKNNKVVYIKNGSDILYINDKKDNKEKVASDVVNYYIDDKEENIVWVEAEGGEYSVYQQDLSLKKDKKTLLKDMDNYDIGSDLKQIIGMQEDILYVVKNFKEKEKVASDVAYYISNSEESGCIYYAKNAENKTTAADLVEDDCAAADKAMQEPNRDDYKVEKVEKNSWTGKYEKYETVDYDKYNAAYDEYYAKESRDEMREELGEYEITNQTKELYCYKDGKEELIDAAYTEQSSHGDTKALIFNRYNMEDIPKVKLSEVDYMGDVEDKYYEALQDAVQTCVYVDGKVVVLNETLTAPFVIDEKNKKGYGELIEGDEEPVRSLVSFDIDGKASGDCKTVADDLGNIEGVRDGKIYYLTEMDDDYSGELYCNDENIDSDVKEGSVYLRDDAVYYTVDYDSSKDRGTLKKYNGKDDTTIADDVFSYKVLGEKDIAVLVDYNTERYRGDLKLYKGKKELIKLDEDVNFIFGGKKELHINEGGVKGMAIFGDISKKISATSQTVVQKAKGMADITGMKSQISDENKKIEKYYQNLGKLYFDLKQNEPVPELQELVALIQNSYRKIEEINAAITSIENTKTCPMCGTPLEDDMIFCVGCGSRIERAEDTAQQSNVSETKFCTDCGNKIPKAAIFCTKCGAKQE